MKSFLKSRTIQGALIAAIATILVGVMYVNFNNTEISIKSNTTSTSTYTEKYYFFPGFDKNNHNSKELESADCWTRSISSDREDAFRCMVSNHIYDPCFVSSFDKTKLVCPIIPPSENLYIKSDIDESEIGEKYTRENQFPWQITLVDGTICRVITGATRAVLDKRVDYNCKGGENKVGFLLLPIYDNAPYHEIDCFMDEYIGRCKIKETWY